MQATKKAGVKINPKETTSIRDLVMRGHPVANQGQRGSSHAYASTNAIHLAAAMLAVNRTFIPYGTAEPPKAKQEPVEEAKPSIPIKQRRKMLAKALRETRSGVARAAPFFCRESLITNGDSK